MNETTVTTSSNLAIVAEFTDGDTRTITVEDPKTDITPAMINSLQSAAAGVLIGDIEGAPFRRLGSVTRKNTTRTEIIFN